tara:strand:+ start:223 stop:336 length:114 start_codon:yes stop_codon:yes gene_type:complete
LEKLEKFGHAIFSQNFMKSQNTTLKFAPKNGQIWPKE